MKGDSLTEKNHPQLKSVSLGGSLSIHLGGRTGIVSGRGKHVGLGHTQTKKKSDAKKRI